MRASSWACASMALIAPALVLCACRREERAQAAPAPGPARVEPATVAPEAAGRLIVSYPAAQQGSLDELARVVRDTRVVDDLAGQVNQVFRLPRDLGVDVRACGEANAYYDPQTGRISVCLELIAYFAELFEPEGEQADAMLADTVQFILVHEVGHALVDQLDLPIAGREEDVADQLATWFMLESYGTELEGVEAVLTAAAWFLEQFDDRARLAEIPFWDSHPLEPQRFYNILCWCYGRFPELTSTVLGGNLELLLPEERRALCPGEYRRLDMALTALLEGHLRPGPAEPVEVRTDRGGASRRGGGYEWMAWADAPGDASGAELWRLQACVGDEGILGPCDAPDPRPPPPGPDGLWQVLDEMSACCIRHASAETTRGYRRTHVEFAVAPDGTVNAAMEEASSLLVRCSQPCIAEAASEMGGLHLAPGAFEYVLAFGGDRLTMGG